MAEKKTEMSSRKNEITIALLGLIGVFATGILSNWDKIFNSKINPASETSYKPTGNFETEMRYFLEVSGARKQMIDLQNNLKSAFINEYIQIHPEKANNKVDLENEFQKSLADSGADPNHIIDVFIPIYQKYFSIEEVQELNTFYSTKTMQNMIKKMPLLAKEASEKMVEMLHKLESQQKQKNNNKGSS